MKQNLIADYLSCILFRGVTLFTFFLPLNFSLFLGRRLGDLIYLFDRKHRAVAYANIKKTVADRSDCASSGRITRKTYQAFAQNLVEISFIPRINKKYLQKYVQIENKDYIRQAFDRGKGVIFLIVHEGNWELSNIICANLNFPFVLFVRDQGFPRLNALLNAYRAKQGVKIIHKGAGVRELIEVLKDNQSIGMTVDQGGRTGALVNFFGREASMSTGAVKLALKHDCAIIPVYYTRVKGPYTKVILDQVFTVTRTNDPQNDLHQNLQRLINIYEKYLRQYPYEYLWTYKIYKYSREREVLILADGKTGHLRQAEGVAKLINQDLTARGMKTHLSIQEVKFRGFFSRVLLNWLAGSSGKYPGKGQGMRFLRGSLTADSWQSLMNSRPDIIISAGGSLSSVNYLLARENQAKSVVLMRPQALNLNKFDLVIIPAHDLKDRSRLVKQKNNVVVTEGALNLIDAEYLGQKSRRLEQSGLLTGKLFNPCLGVLIGGDSKKFCLSPKFILELCKEIKRSAEKLNADILITTSRRTNAAVEQVIKNEFADFARCKLLVIASSNNNPDVVGGILGLSNLIISSPESISMISESACAKKYVVVFDCHHLSSKHKRFLKNYQAAGYIYLKQINELAVCINQLLTDNPPVSSPLDNLKVIEGLRTIL
ncbi:MAG TPA: ELM1/GtrOC1 family putative glycosyltransferase [Candidatus Omnitrophota bacterium]|nr:ELM1/GtrOC1 family putative glycosyltransferase [Candidatus Omnitrophota bacterium]HPT38681.1 ELM1/GtrOC1 family putative glycosyltransferase [Candidatus Omnitrophota bacterium]